MMLFTLMLSTPLPLAETTNLNTRQLPVLLAHKHHGRERWRRGTVCRPPCTTARALTTGSKGVLAYARKAATEA